MQPMSIQDHTRIIGEHQGYIGLPLRDVLLNDSVTGPDTPAMQSAWEATDAERAAIASGAPIILTVVGTAHPPVMLETGALVGESPSERHNRLAGLIVRMIVGGSVDGPEALLLTESVLVGIALSTIKMGGDEAVLDLVFKHARERLAEARLRDAKTEGSA